MCVNVTSFLNEDRFLENFTQNDELVSKDVQLQFVFLQNELHFQTSNFYKE